MVKRIRGLALVAVLGGIPLHSAAQDGGGFSSNGHVREYNRRAGAEADRWKEAVRRGEAALCDRAGDSRSMCYRDIAIRQKNPRICDLLRPSSGGPQGEEAGHCLRGYGIDLPDPSVCALIEDNDIHLRCMLETKSMEETAESCDAFQNDELHHNCMANLAIRNRDMTLCHRLRVRRMTAQRRIAEDPTDNCIVSIARELKDPRLCRSAESRLLQGHCVRNIAWELKDPSLCGRIDTAEIRTRCTEMFSRR